MKFTACYTKIEHGYMGKILEWPGVITEGEDIEDCEEMLKDAAREMALSYYEDGQEIPNEKLIVKPIDIPLEDEAFMSEDVGYHDLYTNGEGKYLTIKQAEILDEKTVNELCKDAGIPQYSEEDIDNA